MSGLVRFGMWLATRLSWRPASAGPWQRGLLAFVLLVSLVGSAAADVPTLRGIAVEETLDDPPLLANALGAVGSDSSAGLVVHLAIDLRAFQGAGTEGAMDRLQARLSLYRTRKIPVVVVLGPLPVSGAASELDVESWRQALRSIVERQREDIAGYEFGAAVASALPGAVPYAFAVKQAAVLIRSIDPDAVTAIGPIPAEAPDWLTRVYAEGIAAYVDAVAIAGPDGRDDEAFRSSVLTGTGAVVGRDDPTAAVWLGPIQVTGPDAAVAQMIVESALRGLGTRVALTVVRAGQAPLQVALAATGRFQDVFSGNLVVLDATAVRWFRGGADVTAQIGGRLLYSLSSGATYLIYGPASTGTAELEVDVSVTTPAIRDPLTGDVERVTPVPRQRNQPARMTVRVAARPLVVDFNFGQQTYSSAAEAREAALPPVEEIIARHQQVQAAQDAVVRNYLAHLRVEMHFRPTPADPAYNIVTENQLFADASGVEWVEQSFSVNGATWSSNRPAFPLLQPEKVLSLPLDLRLNQDYRYRLAGVETVDGREAFAVRFDPAVDGSRTLYRGTVWIDRATFVRMKVSAIQTGDAGMVQSNEEEQIFTHVGETAGRPVWLLTSLTSRQTFLIGGRTMLNERVVRLSDVRLNASDFETARGQARAGNRVMYRDTDRGVRYFVKRGETRVVSEDLTTSARALAMGADIDPSFDYPLPIAGIDILDFNFLNRNMQLALLFGGVIGFGNIQRAGLLSGRADVSVDFFGLALKINDAVFDASGEQAGERLRSLPFSTGANVGYRLSSSHKITGHLELRHDSYFRATETAADFVAPSSTTTTGEGLGYEFRRRGYSLLAKATAYRRSRWTPWGRAARFDPDTQTYVRYDLGLSKDFVFATFHTVHVNGQYFGGRRLDRFSRYQFGLFDAARMHGVPSAVRFGELVMVRGSYSFNLFDQYRLDLFLDHAIGREAGSEPWQPVTGLGAGVNLRGPRSTIIRADVGRSRLPLRYRGAGSTVVQILVLKPL